MTALCDGWKKGLERIKDIDGNAAVKEFINCAKAAYVHLKSALNLAKFSKYKADIISNKRILLECLESERELAKELYVIISKDAKIGFEMTNHYYYNQNLLLEKILNVLELEEEIMAL